MALRAALPLLLLLLLAAHSACDGAVTIPVSCGEYIVLFIGNPGRYVTLRLDHGARDLYLRTLPYDYSWTADADSELVYVGPHVLRLPVVYGAAPSDDPLLEHLSGVYADGVFGLAPESALWARWTRFTLTPSTLVLGAAVDGACERHAAWAGLHASVAHAYSPLLPDSHDVAHAQHDDGVRVRAYADEHTRHHHSSMHIHVRLRATYSYLPEPLLSADHLVFRRSGHEARECIVFTPLHARPSPTATVPLHAVSLSASEHHIVLGSRFLRESVLSVDWAAGDVRLCDAAHAAHRTQRRRDAVLGLLLAAVVAVLVHCAWDATLDRCSAAWLGGSALTASALTLLILARYHAHDPGMHLHYMLHVAWHDARAPLWVRLAALAFGSAAHWLCAALSLLCSGALALGVWRLQRPRQRLACWFVACVLLSAALHAAQPWFGAHYGPLALLALAAGVTTLVNVAVFDALFILGWRLAAATSLLLVYGGARFALVYAHTSLSYYYPDHPLLLHLVGALWLLTLLPACHYAVQGSVMRIAARRRLWSVDAS